jgi:hypothetical protein
VILKWEKGKWNWHKSVKGTVQWTSCNKTVPYFLQTPSLNWKKNHDVDHSIVGVKTKKIA